MSYEKILVPLDGSEFADAAMEEAAELARAFGSKILLAGVVELPTAQFEGYAEFLSGVDVHEQVRDNFEATLRGKAQALRDRGLDATHMVSEGFAHEELIKICDQEGVSCIIMTTHGRTGPARWIMGSVAERVVRAAPCSVLIARSRKG